MHWSVLEVGFVWNWMSFFFLHREKVLAAFQIKLERCRMHIMAFLMVCCLCIVAWGDGNHIKLLGVSWATNKNNTSRYSRKHDCWFSVGWAMAFPWPTAQYSSS